MLCQRQPYKWCVLGFLATTWQENVLQWMRSSGDQSSYIWVSFHKLFPTLACCPFAPCLCHLLCFLKHSCTVKVCHRQHWICFSRCEHVLVQPKSCTGEVLAALSHSQLAFKALLSGHREFVS